MTKHSSRIVAANVDVVNLSDGRQVLRSYDTIVAAFIPKDVAQEGAIHGYIKTDRRFSVTTTRQIDHWLQSMPVKTVPHQLLLELCAPIKSRQ